MLNSLLSFSSVMSTIGSIIVAILVLLLTITIHEFGHYIVGKIFKFKINEFAIGMGPAIFKKVKKNGEIFSIRIFPLGGFCAFEGEDQDEKTIKAEQEKLNKNQAEVFPEMSEEQKTQPQPQVQKLSENAFNNKKPWQRILVLTAGGVFNCIFAVILIFINFACYGSFAFEATDIRTSSGVAIQENQLQSGDVIKYINGNFLYITTDLADNLNGKKKGDKVELIVERNGENKTVEVELRNDVELKNLNDLLPAIEALGIGTRTSVLTSEDSVLPSGKYLYRFNDAQTYEDSTIIYDLEQFAEYLSTKKVGEEIGIWLSVSDEFNENDKQLITVKLDESWAEYLRLYNLTEPEQEGQRVGYKAICAGFFKINSYSTQYQISTKNTRLTFWETCFRPFVYAYKTIGVTFRAIGQIFSSKLSATSLSGPIGTITLTSQYVRNGFNYLLEIAGLIGISVGIFNLLPVPALDGARSVFVLIEWIFGKPVNRKIEGIIHTVGLLVLLVVAIGVDLLKFFI